MQINKNETMILLMALKADQRLRWRHAYMALRGEHAWAVLNRLRSAGAIEHVGYDHWRITEKGRIAAALVMSKNPALAQAFDGGWKVEEF